METQAPPCCHGAHPGRGLLASQHCGRAAACRRPASPRRGIAGPAGEAGKAMVKPMAKRPANAKANITKAFWHLRRLCSDGQLDEFV